MEANPTRADQAKAAGFPTGDAVAIPVLEAAGISSARLVVLTIPDALAARLAVERLRGLAPRPISWYGPRAPGNSKTSAAWASTRRCSRSLEAGLELARQALARFGVAAEEAQTFADGVRRELYAPISGRRPPGRAGTHSSRGCGRPHRPSK